jgi:hypothetical protein
VINCQATLPVVCTRLCRDNYCFVYARRASNCFRPSWQPVCVQSFCPGCYLNKWVLLVAGIFPAPINSPPWAVFCRFSIVAVGRSTLSAYVKSMPEVQKIVITRDIGQQALSILDQERADVSLLVSCYVLTVICSTDDCSSFRHGQGQDRQIAHGFYVMCKAQLVYS